MGHEVVQVPGSFEPLLAAGFAYGADPAGGQGSNCPEPPVIPSTRVRPRRRARLLGATAACSQRADLPPEPKVTSTSAASTPSAVARALPKARPTGMRIEAAGVDSRKMVDLELDATGELGVPDPDTDANSPGWWTGSVTPGETGIAVLVAHFDTRHGPALMKDVEKVELGDTVVVRREDGSTAEFRIREIQNVNKKDFPTDKVYGATDHAELRLLTCGGGIEHGHRTDNIIFYADLAA
ncbi:sortase domain-bontaining protein [Kitasatospora sp. NPDC059088]|uniref:sortase domain-containing protein n=2 Tax=Kitasatospora TaxID=2063 RepID=UPI0036CD1620